MNQSWSVRRRATAASSLVVLLLSSLGPVRAQDSGLGEVVRVRVVEVDVQVTNKKGQPITGLTADDFVLFEDGQPVPIEYFSVTGEPDARSPAAGEVPGEGPTSSATAHQRPSALPLLALYLDHVTLLPADRSRVLDDVARFVESWDGEALLTLLTFDGRLSVEVQPTVEAKRVLRGLETAGQSMAKGFMRASEEERAMSLINSIWQGCNRTSETRNCANCWREMVDAWRVYAEEQAALSRRVAGGLLEAVRTIGALEGRKSIVYVSSGLKRMPGIALNEYLTRLCPYEEREIRMAYSGYELSAVLNEVTALANASRVTVHALDAGGLRPLAAATVRGESALFRFSNATSQLRIANLQSGLFTIARDTGGRAILNENQPFEALTKVGQDIKFGYLLGFSPTRALDRRVHHLKVRLKNAKKGIRLRYRRSYVDHDEDEVLVGRLLAALQLGWGSNPLGIVVVVGEPAALEKNVVQAPVQISVPLGRLYRGDEIEMTGFEMRVLAVAMDSRGQRTVVRRQNLPVVAAADGVYTFEVRMKLPPEHYRIGISLELPEMGQTSYVVVQGDFSDASTAEP